MAIVATHVAAVQELYVAYFGRPADPAGLDYWTNIVEAQKSTTAVSATFAASPEYIVSYFGKTNPQIVDQIYLNLFGRTADTAGRAYWVNLLNNGTIKVDTIVYEVAAAALTTDAEIIENKVAAATAFTAAVDTPAEAAGYAGTAALTLAKAFVSGVTTDTSLATAIAPANLTAQVAAVVKAGTPFTVNGGIAALEAANDDVSDFLDENDLTAATAATELAGDVTTANNAINALVLGYNAATVAGVKAALLAEQQRVFNAELTTAKDLLVAANAAAAAKAGLIAAIANLRAATLANDAAVEAEADALVDLRVAESTFNLRSTTTVTIDADGTASIPGTGTGPGPFPAVDLLVLNSRDNVVFATGVTEAKYPGVTALRDAVIANLDAIEEGDLAEAALDAAEGEALITDNADLVSDVVEADAAVSDAQDNVDDLAEAVADRTDALAVQAEYNTLTKAVGDAKAAFTAAGFAEPVVLDGGSAAATSGSDIFLLGSDDDATISAFGRSGSDSLYVGSQFTLNTGDLDDGVNTVMEIFFIQNGNRTEVHVEQANFGSASDDVTVITLIGVDADDLQLVNGIISLKATTA